MLSGKQISNINRKLNETLVRRLLVQYFSDRGFGDNFNCSIFPPSLQDLPEAIPEIGSEIEIIPYVEDIDPQTGYGRVGWNLFVSGTQRLFLGETEHGDMNDLARQISDAKNGVIDILENNSTTDRTTTPKRIVNFITRILSNEKYGVRSVLPASGQVASQPTSKAAPLAGREMFNHNRPARGEL